MTKLAPEGAFWLDSFGFYIKINIQTFYRVLDYNFRQIFYSTINILKDIHKGRISLINTMGFNLRRFGKDV